MNIPETLWQADAYLSIYSKSIPLREVKVEKVTEKTVSVGVHGGHRLNRDDLEVSGWTVTGKINDVFPMPTFWATTREQAIQCCIDFRRTQAEKWRKHADRDDGYADDWQNELDGGGK